MALLEAKVRGDELAIDGYSVRWPLSAVGLGTRIDGAKVTVGLWPEDIVVETAEAPGFVPVTVSATDFRGRDQAIEVRFGVNRIRKVDSDPDDARARRELLHSNSIQRRRSCSICRAADESAPTRSRTMELGKIR